jgi:glycosyltransferase involved in cell wall biosynthesis
MKPLVSILIPAYNAEKWIADSIQSAMTQTWERKEIIVVDDGSTDRTAAAARRFVSTSVMVVSTGNQGAAAARNLALELSCGDYIQWLDADDLLAPDKIERQLAALGDAGRGRILLSCPWAYFNYRPHRARFARNRLWEDLSPAEWLLRKMGENLHMQTATWLTSRQLAEIAGPWDTRLHVDDDGEYFARVLLASEGTRFVPEARVFYRITPSSRVSHIGISDKKKDALLISMKQHIRCLRLIEDSNRSRKACLAYLECWCENFYPDRPDLIAESQALAGQLGGCLQVSRLRWKYAWMKPLFGWKVAKGAQMALPRLKAWLLGRYDMAMYNLERRRLAMQGEAKQIAESE